MYKSLTKWKTSVLGGREVDSVLRERDQRGVANKQMDGTNKVEKRKMMKAK